MEIMNYQEITMESETFSKTENPSTCYCRDCSRKWSRIILMKEPLP